MEDSWFEDESEDDELSDKESSSEIEHDDSGTSKHEDEIDLDDVTSKKGHTQSTFYSSSSGMTWSSISSYSTKTYSTGTATMKAGPTEHTQDVISVADAFQCFISDNILQKILIYSNTERTRKNTDDDIDDITMIELKACIGLLLLAGLLGQSKKSIKSLWNRSPLESPIFRAAMSRNRFQQIISCIRFDDKTTREERRKTDKFASLREIWTDFQNNIRTCYAPGSFITINEQLLGFRGKCPFRQFIPKKPDKYGLKFWLCVDSNSFYVFNAFPYIGRQPDQKRQKQVGFNVVLDLLKPLYDSNRTVTFDNFFTSVPLAKELQAKKINVIGTLRKNKPEILIEFQSDKSREVGSSLFAFHDCLTLVSFVPKQNQAVLLLSSKHNDSIVDKETGKPNIIVDYNKTKGAVDTVDQMCHKYTVKRATRRWPLCIFYGMIDIAGINALIIWKEKYPDWNQNKGYKRRLFLEELGMSLVSPLLDYRSKTSTN
ncbi:unnamed protein product, partial [Rotaria sordida]